MSAHNYELMFIADPELDENGLKKLTNQHMEIVTKEGGSVENIDIWGRRKLAYEIDGKTEGNIQADIVNASMNALQRSTMLLVRDRKSTRLNSSH